MARRPFRSGHSKVRLGGAATAFGIEECPGECDVLVAEQQVVHRYKTHFSTCHDALEGVDDFVQENDLTIMVKNVVGEREVSPQLVQQVHCRPRQRVGLVDVFFLAGQLDLARCAVVEIPLGALQFERRDATEQHAGQQLAGRAVPVGHARQQKPLSRVSSPAGSGCGNSSRAQSSVRNNW